MMVNTYIRILHKVLIALVFLSIQIFAQDNKDERSDWEGGEPDGCTQVAVNYLKLSLSLHKPA